MGKEVQTITAGYLETELAELGVPKGERLAVAVSGGADSTALLLLAKETHPVTALIVDHALRAESAAEAHTVVQLCETIGVPHATLVWQGDKPEANIQAEAREVRYRLMADWCKGQGVKYILTAHHRDDQAETLLMRLARGSGVYGLAGMARTRSMGADIQLLRPLLSVSKSALINYLERVGQNWIEDPSNQVDRFDRVKIRNFLKEPPLEGFTAERLAATSARLKRTRNALEHYESIWLQRAVKEGLAGELYLDRLELSTEPVEIILRGLASMCRYVSGSKFVPRMEKLHRLHTALLEDGFAGQTLLGVQISSLKDGRLLFVRELAAIPSKTLPEETSIWDNRFEFTLKGAIAGLEICPVGEDGWKQLKADSALLPFEHLPRQCVLALPALFRNGDLQAVPHLKYSKIKEFEVQIAPIRAF